MNINLVSDISGKDSRNASNYPKNDRKSYHSEIFTKNGGISGDFFKISVSNIF